jgi:D-cysteine desulfhydrase
VWGRRDEVIDELAEALRKIQRRPYVIPVGGSSALGSWGYLLAVEELRSQLPEDWRGQPVTLVTACGSGGTAAGLAVGLRLAGWTEARLVAFAVCDDAGYFRRTIVEIAAEGPPLARPADADRGGRRGG